QRTCRRRQDPDAADEATLGSRRRLARGQIRHHLDYQHRHGVATPNGRRTQRRSPLFAPVWLLRDGPLENGPSLAGWCTLACDLETSPNNPPRCNGTKKLRRADLRRQGFSHEAIYAKFSVLWVTQSGALFKFAKNSLNNSKFAGATFSPDGSTFFVNIQSPGLTLAITGDWQSRV